MKTIVMTGGTNGIGLFAARQLVNDPDIRLVVGARGAALPDFTCLPLDLARLGSVRSFAAAVEKWLGDTMIDGLVLNAAVNLADVEQRTEDGYETAFAVNHLAHYLLLRLLTPRLATGAIVVFTTSNLHDPRTNSLAPPEHADAIKLAGGEVELGQSKGAMPGLRAYATSKLCNVLTARALAASPSARDKGISVIAFNPGFTPGTQLSRSLSPAVKVAMAVVVPILQFVSRTNTSASGGGFLADLALGTILPPLGSFYASQIKRQLTWPAISDLAQDDAAMTQLWQDSAALVGLPVDAYSGAVVGALEGKVRGEYREDPPRQVRANKSSPSS